MGMRTTSAIMQHGEKAEKVIRLSAINPLNRGMERSCYAHPGDDRLVIKVPRHGRLHGRRANLEEMKGYQMLRSQCDDLSYVSHCYGYVETDLGEGLLCDCIRDADGAISKTIWDIIIHQEICDLEAIIETTDRFCSYLIAKQIWVFDLNLKNIALRKNSDTSYQPYIIDLKGRFASGEFIPVSRYIPYFSVKKLKRRGRQLLSRIPEYRRRRREIRQASARLFS